jgi:hypothetical protein
MCALSLVGASELFVGQTLAAEGDAPKPPKGPSDRGTIVYLQPTAAMETHPWIVPDAAATDPPSMEELPAEAPPDDRLDGNFLEDQYDDCAVCDPDAYTWQVGPTGLIYRSYLAGPHEPRIGITPFFSGNRSYWDATVGGRGGVLRYGDHDPLHPHGWQLDAYGAAIVRMDPEHHQDLNYVDYVFGFPITYGVENWQFKFGYAHLSSHLGDEYAIRYPGTLDERINYVRDGLMFGASWYPVPACRVYGEFDWAFHRSGGADPIAFQFGNELSRPGPTGLDGSPFLALNGRLRQEVDYGGDLTAEAGWLWRGDTGSVVRIGAHYYNGKSSQSQIFNDSEQQIGIGLWYDF